jgi:hypothetical protein
VSIADKGDTTPRLAGLTFDQWATLAAQMPKVYEATCADATRMRLDWLQSERVLDINARDFDYADRLFRDARVTANVQLIPL